MDCQSSEVIATWISSVSGLVGAVLLVWNLIEARKANNIAQTDAKNARFSEQRALKIATDALDLSRQQVKDFSTFSQQQLRAYVYYSDFETQCLKNSDVGWGERADYWAVQFRIGNAGTTPAYHFRQNSQAMVLAQGVNLEQTIEVPDNAGMVLAAGATGKTPRGCFSAAAHDAALRGQVRLYFICRAEYNDIFGRNHFTNLCVQLKPVREFAHTNENTPPDVSVTTWHNDAS